MKTYLLFFTLFVVSACSSTETLPQPNEVHIKITIKENQKEAKEAQVAYKKLQGKREKTKDID